MAKTAELPMEHIWRKRVYLGCSYERDSIRRAVRLIR
jgi:hypothetical protein